MEEKENNNALTALYREMEEMRTAYEAELAAARAEAAEKKDCAEREKRHRSFLQSQQAYLNEYVEVRLFKDNEKYKDDVYVAINGKNCVIRRGVWTRIRRKFAMLLDQSEIQDLRTAELMEQEASRFASESRRQGV